MNQMLRSAIALLVTAFFLSTSTHAETEKGFVSLFDGKTLNGWKLVNQHGPGYAVRNGILICERAGGGNLFTEKEYEDFIFRFDFKLDPESNNGIGLRAPLEGDAAYFGMECQVLEEKVKKYGPLQAWQVHGSIYELAPAKLGFQKPAGEWNEEEITVIGRKIKVVLNGHTIVDADLNTITNADLLQRHPGMFRERGHIGFLSHMDYAEFRNIRIKELPGKRKDNQPPEGFVALFNGKNLKGWKGLIGTPAQRARMSPDELAAAQKKADELMKAHWKVQKGELVFDGKGKSLCTGKDYGDFELIVDWKIPKDADSGIYLRGCPQVQIWDPESKHGKRDHSVGSGGLHNNQNNPNVPLKRADKPLGEWNRFRILMTGDKVTVLLNNELVVHNVTFENSSERGKPFYPLGPIELQNHGDHLWFKNIFIREIGKTTTKTQRSDTQLFRSKSTCAIVQATFPK